MSESDFNRFVEFLDHFDNAMLVTQRDTELRSRPMAVGDHTQDGRIRFVTRDDSGKLEELNENDAVNVSMQGDNRFLSVSGHARLSKDRDLIDKTWSRRQAPWFAEGKDDPHITVLEVIPTHAEFWDQSEMNAVQLLLEQTGLAPGQTGEADREHGDVDLSDKPV